MYLFRQKVMSAWATGPASGSNVYYSEPVYDPLLGAAEKLLVEVVVTDWNSVNGTLTIFTQWSNTGGVWAARTVAGIISGPGTINANNLTFTGLESNTGGALTRIQLKLAGSGCGATLTAFVCGRAEQSWM
jgi:hypothetical protein